MKIALLITSNSKYSELWDMVCFSWLKVLGNNQIRNHIYISTDTLKEGKFNEKIIDAKFIYYPSNISWTKALRFSVNVLKQKSYTHIITSFDDLIITSFNASIYKEVLSFVKEVDYFKLICSHISVFRFFRKKAFIRLNNNTEYLGSTVLTLWKLNSLESILKDKSLQECSPWEYEKKVGVVFKNLNLRAYTTNRMIFNFKNICIKGFLIPTETYLIKKIIGYKKKFNC